MRHGTMKVQTDLILLLTAHKLNVDTLCELTGQSRRNIYYYLEALRSDPNFVLIKDRGKYTMERNSKFFEKLIDAIAFDERQTRELHRILDETKLTQSLQRKKENLERAIENKTIVKLVGYSSSHSGTYTNRLVEPFLLINNGTEVRCFELSSGKNKTFRLSRMEDVVYYDASWENEDKHKPFYTDVFHYSSENLTPVCLQLDRTAYNSLVEDYPNALKDVEQKRSDDGPTIWLLDTDLCSMVGASRFIMANIDHIIILKGNELREHIASLVANNLPRLLNSTT